MLLQHIVEKLDAELTRLRSLREIVSSLQSPAIDLVPEVMQATQEPAPEPGAVLSVLGQSMASVPRPATGPVRRIRRSHGPRSAPRRVSRPGDESSPALAKTIPSGPVVVSPAALAKERAARTTRPSEAVELAQRPEPGSLGALIRSLELRSVHLS